MTAAERRRIKQAPDLASLQAWVEDLERRIRAKVKRETDRIARVNAPGKSRAQRRIDRKERDAEVRAAVMTRAGGNCEWCGRGWFVLQWAHIFEGGDRDSRTAVDTTAAVCPDCHLRGWHGDKTNARACAFNAARAWAMREGFTSALHEIEKKIAKLEESRASRAAGGTQ